MENTPFASVWLPFGPFLTKASTSSWLPAVIIILVIATAVGLVAIGRHLLRTRRSDRSPKTSMPMPQLEVAPEPVGRDISDVAESKRSAPRGRRVIAVIGIDRYAEWPRLSNAVSDARGALAQFTKLGFEQVCSPLLDESATADAIRRLVIDELMDLKSDDSLVLFFAGHGHTQTRTFGDRTEIKTGYIIPVDGQRPGGSVANWLRLDALLSDVARIPLQHILVILDACHSGVALGSLIKWRGANAIDGRSFDQLHARRSRRVITSALDDQRALDSGPIAGHSLFTGCLIEALSHGLASCGQIATTGSELGLYLQKRVTAYPSSTQTPDFGALELDDRGELIVPLIPEGPRASRSELEPRASETTRPTREP